MFGLALVVILLLFTKVLPIRWLWRLAGPMLETARGRWLSASVLIPLLVVWGRFWYPVAKEEISSLGEGLALASVFSLLSLYLLLFCVFAVVKGLDPIVGLGVLFWSYAPLSVFVALGVISGLVATWVLWTTLASPSRILFLIPLALLGILEGLHRLLPPSQAEELRGIVSIFRFYRS